MDDTVLTALLCAAVAALSGAVLYQRTYNKIEKEA